MSRLVIICLFLSAYLPAFSQNPFQQSVSYLIDVRLDDELHELSGTIEIDYGNRSLVHLDTVWFHLWPNAYGSKFSALCKQQVAQNNFTLQFAKDSAMGRIDIDSVRANGSAIHWGYHPEHMDIAWMVPKKRLAPSENILFQMTFRVKIPSGEISRLGRVGQSYQITQWYPKPAVFDEQGWHFMPYLGQGEFYSEFASYDVKIAVPGNYVVGATGMLQDSHEQEWMDSLASCAVPEGSNNLFPPSKSMFKTLHYVQDLVHDFAWFADKRYIVRKGSIELPRSKKKVDTWALFTPENASSWANAISFINESVLSYSNWVGDYPYSQVTAVDGTISAGGGMEYPMITVIGETSSEFELDVVISHEVGHNWFYGVLANNERVHPWMDEGLNSFMEMQHIGSRYAGLFSQGFAKKLAFGGNTMELQQGYRYQSELTYLYQARRGKDQVLSGESESFTPTNYGAMVYSKTALVFDMLLAYLGPERFIECLNRYFDMWAFNHPRPNDLRAIFEQVSGENLAWCFDDFIRTDKKFDPAALALEGNKFSYRLRGGVIAPFPVSGWADEKPLGTTWVRPDTYAGTVTLPWPSVDYVRIDYQQRTLDIDRTNNMVKQSGLFKRLDPIKLKYLMGFERADREQLYWTLLPAFNSADGFMLGPALYNTTFPSKRTEYFITPMYGFSSGNVVGAFRVEEHFDGLGDQPNGLTVFLNGRRAGVQEGEESQSIYSKISLGVKQELNAKQINKGITSHLKYRGTFIRETLNSINEQGPFESTDEAVYHELALNARRTTGINPFAGQFNLLYQQDGFIRSDIELEYHAITNKKGDRFSLRAFAGRIFNTRNLDSRSAYHTSGQTGETDFLYDGVFFGRSEETGVAAQQFMSSQGGFKSPTLQGASDDYLVALNLELDIPVPIPLAMFGSAANAPVTSVGPNGTTTEGKTLFEGGLGLRIARDILEIWAPLIYSKEIKDEFEFRDRPFHERIRFTLDLTKLDPTRMLRGSAP